MGKQVIGTPVLLEGVWNVDCIVETNEIETYVVVARGARYFVGEARIPPITKVDHAHTVQVLIDNIMNRCRLWPVIEIVDSSTSMILSVV